MALPANGATILLARQHLKSLVMRPPAQWLKPIGTSDWLLDPNWVEVAPRELTYIDFADQGKPSVLVDDYLVYYATGYGRLGIVKMFTPPALKAERGRWPWEAQVRPGLIITDIERGPCLPCPRPSSWATRDGARGFLLDQPVSVRRARKASLAR
jgi:hypothetical protein